MIIVFISWWYGEGWRRQVTLLQQRLAKIVDLFSIDLLLKTLFMPFRQISADQVSGSLSVKYRAFIDKLVSRVIGAVVRTITILTGTLVLGAYIIGGIAWLLAWPLVPLLPVLGVIMSVSGWVPWNQ